MTHSPDEIARVAQGLSNREAGMLIGTTGVREQTVEQRDVFDKLFHMGLVSNIRAAGYYLFDLTDIGLAVRRHLTGGEG